jgi:hypothetical protein
MKVVRFKQNLERSKGVSQADFRESIFQAKERVRARWNCSWYIQ